MGVVRGRLDVRKEMGSLVEGSRGTRRGGFGESKPGIEVVSALEGGWVLTRPFRCYVLQVSAVECVRKGGIGTEVSAG